MRALLLGIVCCLVLLACQPLTWVISSQPGDVLFQDDFSASSSGWTRVSAANGSAGYRDGAYRISVAAANTHIWGQPGLWFKDTRLEADGALKDGDPGSMFGLACRIQKKAGFYTFLVRGDGYYGLLKYKDNQLQFIGMDAMQPTEVLKQGKTQNHLRFDCMGDILTLYLNAQQLGEYRDRDFSEGDVGLIAGTADKPNAVVDFQSFQVLAP